MKTVQVNIVTPDGPVYDSEVTMVVAKTVSGEIGVLAGHIPMVAPLAIGAVKLNKADGSQELLAVNGGFIEVRPDQISILAPAAEIAEAPVEEAPAAEEAPVEEAPVAEEAPAEEATAQEEAPAEETQDAE